MPVFSVIIPLYNKEDHIVETIQSILLQSYSDFEIIVVNDGSTDKSMTQLSSITDNRIKVFDRTNHGVSQTRNFGMKQATGDYIAFMDADDHWTPNHLEDLFTLISNYPDCGLFCTNYYFDYGNNFHVKTKFSSLPKSESWSGIIPDFFEASSVYRIAWTSAVAIPKRILNTVGYFDENITLGAGEDTDYWSRIALEYPVAFTKKVSAVYKIQAINRITNIAPGKRRYMTFEKYLKAEETSASLKKFNDIHRYDFALKHKMAGINATYQYYKKDIDFKNFNIIQIILLKCPTFLLIPLWKFKQWLKSKKIDINL